MYKILTGLQDGEVTPKVPQYKDCLWAASKVNNCTTPSFKCIEFNPGFKIGK